MKFTVGWTPAAEQELLRFWLAARDRLSIDEAVQTIELQLATDPMNAGESRVGTVRVLIVEPLSVVFSVRVEDRFVKVIEISHRIRRREQN